jgi:6-pyruvoyl-tetrahydropterin synthase
LSFIKINFNYILKWTPQKEIYNDMDDKKLIKIKSDLENQFVDDFEDIKKFMSDVNDTLDKINIKQKYESYNEFCLDIEKFVFEIIDNYNVDELSTAHVVLALNNMIKYKISLDENYEEKIRGFFENPESIINEIKNDIKN